ncbi:AAA family ATPase [Aquiflexum lacus]|uniref:AAA family ATPase n=1 Tax=Aquiflexum lacus TaxID=2483805 RepID=UPI001894C4D2|nr:AAA family ATPase [Aquiflexum lacus]
MLAESTKFINRFEKEIMLIMVMGLPGSGKSFFAKSFAEKLGAEYFSSDLLRTKMGLRGKYLPENKNQVYMEMAKRTKELIEKNKSVVLDATFFQKKFREFIYSIAETSGVPLFIFLVQADENIIKQRLSAPRKDSEADHSVYLKIKEQFEPLERPFLTLNSTNDNLSEILLKASQYINRPNEQQ